MKALGVILLIIFFPIFLGTLLLLSLKLTLFSPNYVKEELKEQKAYSVVYKNIPELLKTMGPREGMEGPEAEKGEAPEGGPTGIFSPEETASFFYNTVNEQNFQEKTEATIDSVWPWIFGGKQLKPIPIEDIRQKLSDNILAGFRQKYEALPYCKDPSEFKYDLKTCQLKGKGFDELLKEFLQQKNGNPSTQFLFAGNVPNEFDIQKFTEPNPQLNAKFAGAQNIRSKVSPILGNAYILFTAVLMLVFLISRLLAGAWKKTPKIFGIYIAIVSVVFLMVSLLLNKLAFPKLVDFAGKKIQALPAIKDQLLVPMVKDIFRDVSSVQIKISLSLIILGIILAVGFVVLDKYIFKKELTVKTKPDAAENRE